MNVGFIGTGNMGSTLIHAFLQSQAIQPSQMMIFNRSSDKINHLAAMYPEIQLASTNEMVVQQSDIVFLCVKPSQFQTVLEEIRSVTCASHRIVFITSGLLIRHLELQLPAKISKVIPSITQLVRTGVSLVTHGQRMTLEDRATIEFLFSQISVPIQIEEHLTRVCSDITSCGPAFTAAFLEQFMDAACIKTTLDRTQAIRLLAEMMKGTAELLLSGMTPAEIKKRVAVPGGITTQGLQVIEHAIQGLFEELLKVTHGKYEEDIHAANQLFTSPF